MAKEILPVDFKDDIMSESMEGRRRYRMIQNPDGTVSFEDTTEYDQIGSLFGQGQINKTNQAVNESLDKSRVIDNINDIASNSETGYVMGALAGKELNQNLGGLKFRKNAGNAEYYNGAEWVPFKGGWRSDVLTPVAPFSDTENGWFLTYYDISSLYRRYKEITIDNIVVQLQAYAIHEGVIGEMSYAYNPELGKVIVKLNPVHFYPPSRYEGRPSIRIAIVI